MNTTAFDTLLQSAKNGREMSRDWMVLRTEDSSITFTTSDTYLSTKTLPTRFLRVYKTDPEDSGVFLVNAAGGMTQLSPIPFNKRFQYKDTGGYFYIDVKNGAIGRTGGDAGTLHIFYLEGTDDLSDTLEWSFPEFAHPLLAYDMAVIQKGGIDWDTVNAAQIPYNQAAIRKIEADLAMWDSRLQQAEIGV